MALYVANRDDEGTNSIRDSWKLELACVKLNVKTTFPKRLLRHKQTPKPSSISSLRNTRLTSSPSHTAPSQRMRKLVPGAVEMVYDNYNWLVIGFSPTERPSEAIFSLVLPPGRATLCFLQGAGSRKSIGSTRSATAHMDVKGALFFRGKLTIEVNIEFVLPGLTRHGPSPL